jgi:mannose-1-phosphate guanylyltransferase
LGRLKAVILVGGPGTRLRPLTNNCPKPIVPVLNRPFLEHTLAHLRQSGIDDVILAMSYLPDAIREYFGDGERFGMQLTYCIEKEPLGTAGAVKNAAPYLDRPFIVLNGDDVFLEMNIDEVYAFHREKEAKATIFLTKVENPSAFGVVETDENYKVLRFIEKPPPGTTTSNLINAGGYVLEPEVLEYIPAAQHYMFEKGLFPRLLQEGEPVYGYPYHGYWLDVGTPEKYYSLNIDLLLEKSHSPLFQDRRPDGLYLSKDITRHLSAVITGPAVIGRGCRIGKDVRITGPVTIGQDCLLEDGADIQNAVLWDNVRIGAGATLERCIVSSDTAIGKKQNVVDSVATPSQTAPLLPGPIQERPLSSS